ncbi:MAG: uracil-DNA glycosylase [Polyangia bacterium]
MREPNGGEVVDLARALADRLRWEAELGAEVFPPASRAVERPVATRETPPGERDEARDPGAELEALRAEIGDCERCPLHAGRNRIVFGGGRPDARLVLVGEGPGREEDLSGRPFVGPAGQLLDRILAAIGLSREDVYICNVVKCRPPGNRDPEPEEAQTCGRFLRRQLRIIHPQVIIALGRPAAAYLLDTAASVRRMRGRFHDYEGIDLMPTYHPAYLLRNESAKRPVWEDFKKVRDRLGLPPLSRPGGAR